MTINQNQIIGTIAICSVTLLGIIALTRNTDIKLDLNLGRDLGSLTIEGKRTLSSPEKTNDCLPNEKSSHRLNCDHQ